MADVEHERVQAFVDQMCEATARLVRLPASGSTPVGVASGVLVPRQGVWRLLTAGHALKKTGIWCIETRVILSDERKTLLIKVGQPQFIARFTLTSEGAVEEEEIDFAWVDMREQQLRDALASIDIPKGTEVDVPLYLGPMTERPTKGEPYGFASWSNADMFEEKKVLLRQVAYEVYLEYDGLDPGLGLYRFKITRDYQGREYYAGTSGAPIADSTGLIVSLVVGGSRSRKAIYGVPLADYAHLTDL